MVSRNLNGLCLPPPVMGPVVIFERPLSDELTKGILRDVRGVSAIELEWDSFDLGES